MPNNKYTIKDTYGLYSDYIEIYNGYDYDINLEDITYQMIILIQKNGHFQTLL